MTRIALSGGHYQARSLIANAQRCINLYPEKNPQDAEAPYTYYPVPGKTLQGSAPAGVSGIRGAYTASTGVLYIAIGSKIYAVSQLMGFTAISTALTTSSGPVSMKDNGATLVVVDGSTTGVRVTLADNTSSTITSGSDANWRGADAIWYVDGFFICNQPGTQQWFISDINAATFTNGLYFASKGSNSDLLQTVAVMHREVWLLGVDTTEIFFNAGDVDFPFERMPGVFIQHGCAAKASVATWDLSLFWLGRDPQGQYVVFRGASYEATRISTHAMEVAISKYGVVSDAIGYCYQQQGHPFYVLTFPTADATWVYDLSTDLWHERGRLDANGRLHRDKGNCHALAYGMNIVGDYSNGNLYALDPSVFTDNGDPIQCLRSFPTIDIEDRRVFYRKLTLDMQTGVGLNANVPPGYDPTVNIRWSDDGGNTWGNPVQVRLGEIGQFNTRATLWRMGYGRRRVYEVSWASPIDTALNGAWLDYEVAES